MKKYISQFVLVLSLLCNPMAGLLASVSDNFETSNSTMGQMPCHEESLSSQLAHHDTDGKESCLMDCCEDDVCNMDQSCQDCLVLHFDNMMSLDTLKFSFPDVIRNHIRMADNRFTDHLTLPEIHPPDSD